MGEFKMSIMYVAITVGWLGMFVDDMIVVKRWLNSKQRDMLMVILLVIAFIIFAIGCLV